jgi:hypothetical protein
MSSVDDLDVRAREDSMAGGILADRVREAVAT